MSLIGVRDPVSLGTPISSVRQFTTALSPRSGGWMFVTQGYADGESRWITIKLETEAVTTSSGKIGVYSNSQFNIGSFNVLSVESNQLRAANGKIFFPQGKGNNLGTTEDYEYANFAYYDPTDETIHQLPALHLGAGATYWQDLLYSATFDHAGTVLYTGTQAAIGSIPTVTMLDPVTLTWTVLGQVGVAASSNPKYAYYLAKDEGDGAQWLYVAVGQDPWELVKINVNTGVATVLLTTNGPGNQHIEFEDRVGYGWSVNVVTNGVQTRYWLGDGAITAYDPNNPPFTPRTVTPYSNPLTTPPQIDWSQGIGFVRWRAYGSTGEWTQIEYNPNMSGSIVTLESLYATADRTVLGNGAQYGGFFKYVTSTEWFGQWPGGVSQPVMMEADGFVYITGYPNGVLYKYRVAGDWGPDGTDEGNPALIGSFHDADTKYPYFLIYDNDETLYYVGRIERVGLGTGFGTFNINTEEFTGVTGFDEYVLPRGAVLLASPKRLVYSGERVDATTAQLIVLDEDLAEIRRITIESGMFNTGQLFKTSNRDIVVGLTNDAPTKLYRVNVNTGAVLQLVTLNKVVGPAAQHDDLSIWAILDGILTKIDSATLARSSENDLSARDISVLAWAGDNLYATDGAELLIMTGNAGAVDNPKGIAPYRDDWLPPVYEMARRQMRKRRF